MVEGKRKKGRQKRTWKRHVEEECLFEEEKCALLIKVDCLH